MARLVGGLLAALVLAWPAAPASAAPGDAWPDGVDQDSVRAATVGAASITAGRSHSCAVTSAGATFCWGDDSDGQLGDGDPLVTVNRAVPVQAGDMQVVVQIDAGAAHTCALEYHGQVFCWGDNSSGQLGVGDNDDRHAPVATTFPPAKVMVEVTTGDNHSCAIDEDGAAWCWGDNAHGQLGVGGSTASDEPVRVTTVADPVVDIAAGGDTTCAATADGVAWCWGGGNRGQLGDGAGVDRDEPVRVSTAGVLDDAQVRQIAVGKQQSCAVDQDGRASCWGRTATGAENVPVAAGGPAFSQVAVGGEHVCGLDLQETAWCWGVGGEGQLGDGGSVDRTSPVRVSDATVRDLDSGDEHTCSLDARYVAYCWGNGDTGRLGAGATAASPVPVMVQGLPRAPAAVTGVRVVPIDGGLRVSWRPVTDFGSGDFVSYLAVTSDFAVFCSVGTSTGGGCDLTGLTNGTDYDVTVLTYATEGTTISEFATAAPKAAPVVQPTEPVATPTPTPTPTRTSAPGANAGELPITDSPGMVLPLAAVGFLLIGIGLSALLIRDSE